MVYRYSMDDFWGLVGKGALSTLPIPISVGWSLGVPYSSTTPITFPTLNDLTLSTNNVIGQFVTDSKNEVVDDIKTIFTGTLDGMILATKPLLTDITLIGGLTVLAYVFRKDISRLLK